MKKTIVALWILHLEVAILAHMEATNQWIFKDLMRNYSHVGNGYDIFSIILLILVFILAGAAPKVARALSLPLYVLILALVGYLAIFSLNWGQKTYNEFHDIFVSAYLMFFSATTGILVALLSNS